MSFAQLKSAFVDESGLSQKLLSLPLLSRSIDIATNQSRRLNFFLSRQAMMNTLQLNGEVSLPENWGVVDHNHLSQYPQSRISFSHTDGLGACVLAPSSIYKGVGIDIEWQERPLPEGSGRYFMNDRDQISEGMDLWCTKEACFKSCSALPGKSFKVELLSELSILKDGQFIHEKFNIKGFWHLEHRTINDRKLRVAFAVILR
jgi:4'-phosphopantetheinyl transferase EntD